VNKQIENCKLAEGFFFPYRCDGSWELHVKTFANLTPS